MSKEEFVEVISKNPVNLIKNFNNLDLIENFDSKVFSVFINDIDYNIYLNNIDILSFKKLKKIQCCPCCNSILKKWGATYRLKSLVIEIIEVININQRIKERKNYLLIHYKYNIPIYIYTYL